MAPWRTVEHSELRISRRGREQWALTLECGHHDVRTLPVLVLLPAMVRMRERPAKSRLAPRRVRCQLCGYLENRKVAT